VQCFSWLLCPTSHQSFVVPHMVVKICFVWLFKKFLRTWLIPRFFLSGQSLRNRGSNFFATLSDLLQYHENNWISAVPNPWKGCCHILFLTIWNPEEGLWDPRFMKQGLVEYSNKDRRCLYAGTGFNIPVMQFIYSINYTVSRNHVMLSSKWMVTFSSLHIFIQILEPSNSPPAN
jgi:hypothetical protein